jgi:uncharacterized DUF497 family protein
MFLQKRFFQAKTCESYLPAKDGLICWWKPIIVFTNVHKDVCMIFVWDEHKRLNNLDKHGIDFVDVFEAFDAPMVTAEDYHRASCEIRTIASGRIRRGIVIILVYLEHKRSIIRLISARKANSCGSHQP